MKKLLMVALSLVMMITLVACSSKPKNYEEDINKILTDRELNRNEVNIRVYENVELKTGEVDGKHTLYMISSKITLSDGKTEENNGQGFVISKTNSKVISIRDAHTQPIKNSNKPVYEEINIK